MHYRNNGVKHLSSYFFFKSFEGLTTLSGMIDVNEDLTRRTAELARLELTDEEVRTFTPQLKEILKYVELLAQADVKDVSPMTHPLDLTAPMREDAARPSPTDADGKPKTLGPAPEVVQDGFKVPPIL